MVGHLLEMELVKKFPNRLQVEKQKLLPGLVYHLYQQQNDKDYYLSMRGIQKML
jgi:hypothetical protein